MDDGQFRPDTGARMETDPQSGRCEMRVCAVAAGLIQHTSVVQGFQSILNYVRMQQMTESVWKLTSFAAKKKWIVNTFKLVLLAVDDGLV